MKWLVEPAAIALSIIIVIVVIVVIVDVGIRAPQHQITPTPTPEPVTPVATEIVATIPTSFETTSPLPETPTLPPTPTPPRTYAVATTPIRDPNYYPLPYYSTIYNPGAHLPPTIFQQSYNFNFQYEAVLVNVVQSPLIIDFAVSPGSSSPIRSFFMITVRENSTHNLLAQDGYFRTYSSNSPKRLIFSSPGTYHINMYGSFVSAYLTLRAPT